MMCDGEPSVNYAVCRRCCRGCQPIDSADVFAADLECIPMLITLFVQVGILLKSQSLGFCSVHLVAEEAWLVGGWVVAPVDLKYNFIVGDARSVIVCRCQSDSDLLKCRGHI